MFSVGCEANSNQTILQIQAKHKLKRPLWCQIVKIFFNSCTTLAILKGRSAKCLISHLGLFFQRSLLAERLINNLGLITTGKTFKLLTALPFVIEHYTRCGLLWKFLQYNKYS